MPRKKVKPFSEADKGVERRETFDHALRIAQSELRGDSTVAVKGGFHEYIERRNPTLLNFEHVPKVVDVMERVVSGEIQHLIIIEPPRYFKSEIATRLLPGYFLRQRPDKHCSIVSYGADLAWDLSAEAKEYYQADGGVLAFDATAKKRWKTEEGGGLWAAGVGGPLLGFGFHLGIIDDPTDPEKAYSPAYQRRFREWFPAKYLSRREPGARIIVVMQRLGTDDPIDFLFRREVGEDTDLAPMNWHVLFLDEIKSDEPIGRWSGPRGLPPTCTVEPDWREAGEVLAPSRFTPKEVQQTHTITAPYVTSSQRQGRPMSPTGDFWQKDWFTDRTYEQLPPLAHNGGWDWDTAYTKDEAQSATAGIRSFRGPGAHGSFDIYIDDIFVDWLNFPELVEKLSEQVGPHYVEGKASGKSVKQTLQREGIAAKEVSVIADKFARASAVQPVVANRRIYIRRGLVTELLSMERFGLLRITAERLLQGGPDLDLNDAFVQAVTRHTGGMRLMRGTRVGSVTQTGLPGGGRVSEGNSIAAAGGVQIGLVDY